MSPELEQARAPLASLLSKSEKAQQKLTPGSWQHSMLAANIAALRLAMSLLFPAGRKAKRLKPSALKQATTTLTAMINRSVKAQAKFALGTSPHTLQRNRIKALRLAKKGTTAELKRIDATTKKK
jgi:hypothetical protein